MDFISLVPSTVLATQNSATYSCTLTNLWSAENHPVGYDQVRNSAHWSPPVFATHGEDYEMWAPNEMASPGVEGVAETGSTSLLETEIEAAQTDGIVGDFEIGNNQFNANDPPQTVDGIQLTPGFPFLSTITMVAPSPDWFTGIPKFSPIDEGFWLESFGIATFPWDAGTEQGDTYSINNNPENPQFPITQLTAGTIPGDSGILLDESGTKVLPMALWSCALQKSTPLVVPPIVSDPQDENEIPVLVPDEQTPIVSEPPEQENIVAVIDGNGPTKSPDEQPPIVSEPQDENEIPVLVPDEQIPIVSEPQDDNEIPVSIGGVCLRYFRECTEDSECCSGACERERCRAYMRGPGRSESFRLSNQGGGALGGAAGRSRRSGGRKLLLLDKKKEGQLRGFFK